MRFAPLQLIAWLTCTLLAAAAPAAAWDKKACLDTDGPKAFRDKMAGILTQVDTTFFRRPGVDGFDTYKQEAYDTINGCQKSLSPADRQPFASCMRRTMTYADIISRSQNDQTERFGSDFSLGLDVDNYSYFRSYGSDILKIPPCLNDPKYRRELFEKLDKTVLSDLDSVEMTVNLIQQRCKGAVVVPYVSQTVTSLDGDGADKHGRIVVLIQDDNTDHYVQFTVSTHNPSGESGRRQASVVKVRKSGGATGNYIFDWQRTDNNEFAYRDRDGSLFGNDQHCYTCHWSGVLAIHPFQTTTSPDVGQAGSTLGPKYEKWLKPLNDKYHIRSKNANFEDKKRHRIKIGGRWSSRRG